MIDLFAEIFRATPLCHVINDEVFVVHGGIPGPDPRVWWKGMDNQISFDGRQIQISLSEIENSNRFMEPNPDENPLMVDLLWSDPKGKDGYGPSGRMSSGIYLFGPDVSRNFMEFNGLKMTLRSHEVKAQGYRFDHEGAYPLITVFSAPNYVDKAGNMASVAVL
ncbi:PP5, partial [Symbiodinium necroappetens]